MCSNYKHYQHLLHLSNILIHKHTQNKTPINPYHCAELLAMRRFALRQLLGEPLDFCVVDGTQGADIRQSALVVVRQFLHLPREKGGKQWKTVEIVVKIDGIRNGWLIMACLYFQYLVLEDHDDASIMDILLLVCWWHIYTGLIFFDLVCPSLFAVINYTQDGWFWSSKTWMWRLVDWWQQNTSMLQHLLPPSLSLTFERKKRHWQTSGGSA